MAKRGESVLDLIEVMDRLRSPGGCPWDARQTHQSLVEYLVEEAYETVEAIEGGDDSGLREELGDLLLQVVFHSRIAQERGEEGWDVDDVARGIVEKLIRRHPHVFADVDADTAEQVEANWHALKAEEKGRASVVDGIPEHLLDDKDTLTEILEDEVADLIDDLPKRQRSDDKSLEQQIRRCVRSLIGDDWGKRPVTDITIFRGR